MLESWASVVVDDHVHNICTAIEFATSAVQVLELLQYASSIYLAATPPALLPSPPDKAPKGLQDCHNSLQKALTGGQACELGATFWRSFTSFAETLLAVVADQWLGDIMAGEAKALFNNFFEQAPAHVALSAIVMHLATVQPVEKKQPGSVAIAALGAQVAAQLLIDRFVQPNSCGIAELTRSSAASDGMAEAANLLVSIPERAASTWLPEMQPERFVPSVVSHLLTALVQQSTALPEPSPRTGAAESNEYGQGHQPSAGNRGGEASTSAPSEKAGPSPALSAIQMEGSGKSAFAGCVLSRLAKRGYSRQVAKAVWAASGQEARQERAGVQHVGMFATALAGIGDSAAIEKLGEALLAEAPFCSGLRESAALDALQDALTVSGLAGFSRVGYLLQDKLLLHNTLPPLALHLLIKLLARLDGLPNANISIQDTTLRLAQAWGSIDTVQRLPVQRQAYITAALMLCLREIGKVGIEGCNGLAEPLLAGVATRLDSPSDVLRRQGMRVGSEYAKALSPDQPLFHEHGPLDLLPEELWRPECAGTSFGIPSSQTAAVTQVTKPKSTAPAGEDSGAEGGPRVQMGFGAAPSQQEGRGINKDLLNLEPMSDLCQGSRGAPSEDGTATDSDDSLEPYDLDDDEEVVGMDGDRPIQLRDLAERLRKTDNSETLVKALSVAGPLIEAAPDELANYSGEIARSLLYCSPPDWADQEAADKESKPGVQRLRAMTSLLVEAPREGGLALAEQFYSPHLDLHQRLLILDTMSTAATQMSLPPSQSRAALLGQQMQPNPPDRVEKQTTAATVDLGRTGKTRAWGLRSLALQKAQQQKTFRNRFPEVAVEWVSALLKDAGQELHGVDLLGRDFLLLSRVLDTLGVFVQAAAPTLQTVQLAATTLEMLRAPAVHNHPQPFVRRAALVAASQVLSSLPPARLAGAMTGGRGDTQDSMLVERLEWLREWLVHTAQADTDSQVRMLAAGCQLLQADLASRALERLETDDSLSAASLLSKGPAEMLGLGGSRPSRTNIDIKLPSFPGS